MSTNYYRMTKQFLLHEGQIPEANILTYIQALSEVIENMRPKTQVESRRLSMAKQQLREIKKMARRMQEQINVLGEINPEDSGIERILSSIACHNSVRAGKKLNILALNPTKIKIKILII